jgi:hypothetical protein
MRKETESGLGRLLGSSAAVAEFWRAWPWQHYATHGGVGRIGDEICSREELVSIPALLGRLRELPGIPIRVWSSRPGEGARQRLTDASEALSLYETSSVTVVVDGIHRFIPGLAEWMRAVRADLSSLDGPYSCNLYGSREGVGTDMHFDEQDNFFLQLKGRKEWLVSPNTTVEFPTASFFGGSPSPELRAQCRGPIHRLMPDGASRIVLEPGSVLALPRGYWHQSSTRVESVALTLSFRTPTWSDEFLRILKKHLDAQSAWRHPIFRQFYLRTGADDWSDFLGPMVKKLGEELETLRPHAIVKALQGTLHVRKGRYTAWRLESGLTCRVAVSAEGVERGVRVPAEFVPFLNWLSGQSEPFDLFQRLSDFEIRPSDNVKAAIKLLLDSGILDPVKPIHACGQGSID